MDVASVSDLQTPPARSVSGVPAAEIRYRADIDGLRALAVLPVVLFHYGASLISGGFAGVDIFFVISGYLISGIIMADLERGRYSILGFYERRVRRIVPALIVLLLACTVASALVLFPADFSNYGKSLCATLSFLSNFYFWHDSDYFARAAEWKPLLHTWSLGVEEQFYIVFPLLLGGVWPLGRRVVGAAAVALFALSLLASAYAAVAMPTFGFYMPVTRAYELLLGFFVAFAPRARLSELAKSALSFVGLVAILLSIVLVNRDTPFPGWVALAPAGGAALMILTGLQGPVPLFNRLLQAPPLTFFGKISYSLYLWHWPILVFYKYRIGRDPTLLETAGLFMAAVALAYLSWRFVEAPFRDRSRFSRGSVFAMAGVATAIMFCCGAAIVEMQGLPQRIPPSARQYLATDPLSRLAPCFGPSLATIQQGRLCAIGAGHTPDTATFAVWGDSHAYRLATALDPMAAAEHKTGVLLSSGGCPPLPGVTSPVMNLHACGRSTDAALTYIESHRAIRTVILSAIWAIYPEGAKVGHADGIDRSLLTDAQSKGYSPEESRRAFARTLVSLVERLRRSGREVVIVGPVPELETSAPEALARKELYGGSGAIGPSYADFLTREEAVLPVLQALSRLDGVVVLYPSRYLCDAQRCRVDQQGKSLYMDDNHLSDAGVGEITPLLRDALDKAPN